MNITALKGVNDILPREIAKWDYLESCAKKVFSIYGYRQIKIPVIGESRLFVRSIGEQTDIVEKEMYTFTDRGQRKIALRPEATASVVRAYLEHKLEGQDLARLFYSGPMFRGEKPQSGRNRQFYQIGVEALGCEHPQLDAEVIILALEFLNKLGLKKFSLNLNTVGCTNDKDNFAKTLKTYLKGKLDQLCPNCQNRYKRNVLRTLDCKVKSCQKVIQSAPNMIDAVCPGCSCHFDRVKSTLDSLSVCYNIMPHLVRGLDYYTKTVFEITHADLGAQNAICAGGRYDNLIKELGGTKTGAIGFAFGTERTILAAEAENIDFPKEEGASVYIIGLGQASDEKVFELAQTLRKNQISCYLNYNTSRALKKQLRQADKLKHRFVLILGEDELKSNCILLKDMDKGTQESIEIKNVVSELKNKLNK